MLRLPYFDEGYYIEITQEFVDIDQSKIHQKG